MQKNIIDLPYTTILFDMDNTLFDFIESLKLGATAAINVIGDGNADKLLSYYLRFKYNVEDHANLQDYLVDNHIFSVDTYLKCIDAFEHAKYNGLVAYPYIHELLSKLKNKGYNLGIVTDAYEYAAMRRLNHLNLHKYFDIIVTPDDTGCKKPRSEPFVYAMDLIGSKPYETVYIGDSIYRDIEPAKKLGLSVIYAKYGDKNYYFESVRVCPP
ncbi:MAG TPA: HAD family hydrolase, partial [Methanocorpusculum sp.]|nr:HAD family hydrolase [Methanocorpusculum sp.]